MIPTERPTLLKRTKNLPWPRTLRQASNLQINLQHSSNASRPTTKNATKSVSFVSKTFLAELGPLYSWPPWPHSWPAWACFHLVSRHSARWASFLCLSCVRVICTRHSFLCPCVPSLDRRKTLANWILRKCFRDYSTSVNACVARSIRSKIVNASSRQKWNLPLMKSKRWI